MYSEKFEPKPGQKYPVQKWYFGTKMTAKIPKLNDSKIRQRHLFSKRPMIHYDFFAHLSVRRVPPKGQILDGNRQMNDD
jgi:hypothetical protein